MGRKHDTGLPWVDRSVDVDGVPVHYLEAGRGETLLLVHGGLVWCSAELTYGAVIPLLARTFRVVAVDVVGFGLTPARALKSSGSRPHRGKLARRLAGAV